MPPVAHAASLASMHVASRLQQSLAVAKHGCRAAVVRCCLLNVALWCRRWFCLAAVASSGSGAERIVGFVAAALGSVQEFPQVRQQLPTAIILQLVLVCLGNSTVALAALDGVSTGMPPCNRCMIGSSVIRLTQDSCVLKEQRRLKHAFLCRYLGSVHCRKHSTWKLC
jgi:hypothetical protein